MQTKLLTDYYSNGMKRMESVLVETSPVCGVIRGWHQDGSPEFEIIMSNGVAISRKNWEAGLA